jgi:endogenous inhibitor of DNA gyrase (YacG/DUF329 family)
MVICPNCKKKVAYSQTNPFRPFCSERCKLIDLGAWADEKYRIPLQVTSQDDESSDDESYKSSQNDEESF